MSSMDRLPIVGNQIVPHPMAKLGFRVIDLSDLPLPVPTQDSVAIYEAGRAIVAHALGQQVTSLEICLDEAGAWQGCTPRSRPQTLQEWFNCECDSTAGKIAGKLFDPDYETGGCYITEPTLIPLSDISHDFAKLNEARVANGVDALDDVSVLVMMSEVAEEHASKILKAKEAVLRKIVKGLKMTGKLTGGPLQKLMASGREVPAPILQFEFTTGEKRKPDPKRIENVATLLEYKGTVLRKNTFTGEIELGGIRGFSRMTDSAFNEIYAYGNSMGLRCGVDDLTRNIDVLANARQHHPVRDYLKALKWDGVPRLDGWLATYAGAEDLPLYREFGRVMIIGAVLRVLYPGCKFDYMLVLEGPQGVLKSTLFRVLGREWFADSLKLGTDPKETIEQTRGVWIAECAELSGMGSREVEAVKAQVTTPVDRARMAYGRYTETVKRQFVMVGTTNDAQYLRDRTGNRRFLPVRVGKINIEALTQDVDQLWAEAYHRATVGQEKAILNQAVIPAAIAAQAARVVADPFRDRLSELLDGFHGRVTKEDIWRAVGHDTARTRTQAEANRLTATMKELGWTPKQARRNGPRVEAYEKAAVSSPEMPWVVLMGGKFTQEGDWDF